MNSILAVEPENRAQAYGVSMFLDTYDFDSEGRWKPSSWLRCLQRLGTEQCHFLGFDEPWMAEHGFYWVVVRMVLKIDRNPMLGAISGETWHPGLQGPLWRRDYQLNDSSGRLGGAISLWGIIDRNDRRLLRPRHFPQGFPILADRQALEAPPTKLHSEDLPLLATRLVLYSDIDSNGHANNSRYAEWVSDALPSDMLENRWTTGLQVDFRHEVLLGDMVHIHGAPVDEARLHWHFVAHVGDNLSFVARLTLSENTH